MIVGNLALKDRVDKSEWYRGYSPLSILLRGFFNLDIQGIILFKKITAIF